MARTELRMMPTFPSSPLKFRTAGFPQYGFKAGVSAGAFPAAALTVSRPPGLHPAFVPTASSVSFFLRSVLEHAVRSSTAMQATAPLYPRGPRSGPGSAVPVHQHLFGPIRPLAGTARFRCLAAYTPCLRCALPPRRPATGSLLSLLTLSQHVVLYDSGQSSGCMYPVPSPPTLAFVSSAQTRHSRPSHKSVSRGGVPFGALLRFALATTC